MPASRPERQAAEDKPASTTELRPREDAGDETACRAALTEIGAVFEDAPAVEGGKACGIDSPILLAGLPGGVCVEPAATVRCETA